MGESRMGPPVALLLELAGIYAVSEFIESGTYLGNTAYWASQHFDHVTTIEYSQELYQRAVQRFGHVSNIRFSYGDTRQKLAELASNLRTPAIFWLDAHWCSGATYGASDQCPLLEEIGVLNRSKLDHFIFVDDARFFMSPQPRPNDPEQWPTITELLGLLSIDRRRYIVIVEDVIVAVPMFAHSVVARYCQETNAAVLRKRLRPIVQDLRLALHNPVKAFKSFLP